MSLQNLIEDYLYDLLPEGIIDLDEQGLIQAVIGGYQDRIDDTRSYISKLELLVTANGLPETDNSGSPVNNVVLCQVQSPQGKVYNRSLDFESDTPAAGDPALLTWAADQLQLDESHVLISATYGVDMLRLVDANILGYLAETVGAVLYQTAAMDPDNAQNDARRLLATWFPRLQFKGTAQSFETLGRLLGFDDVRMSPLWGRLSPRIANDIGDPRNNQDFSAVPDYFPKQARDNFYDPWVLNDGPFFTWTGTASARFGQSDTRFYSDVVNGFNPFVSVSVVGTAPTDPDPAGAPYILVGGGPEKQASVEPPGSGLLFKAISSGSSFNGLEINFTAIDNGTSRIISITDRLSAIKYRTSYFDLGLTMDFDHALEQFGTVVATANKDLVNSPTSANFGATAVSPFRPWMSGSIKQELITADWITRTNTNGNLTIVSPRVQADLTSRQFDQDALSAAGAQVVAAMEEVRPATRTPRQVNVGYLIEDQVGYAAFCEKDQLFVTHSGTSIYSGTITDFPTPPYSVQFQTGTIDVYQEQSITNSGFLTLKTSDLLASGTFDYRNASWILRFPGTVQSGTIVNVIFEPTSTEVVRSNPGTNCIQIGYQDRPEDFLDNPALDMPDEYPWRRSLVGGGELVDLNDYSPATPDLETIRLGQTASVASQSGAQYDVQVVVPGPYPPRFVTAERSLDDYIPGQRAIAFSGTFLNLAGTRPSSGTLQGGLDGVMQPGWQLYHFGLVQGVLVADAPKFFGKHHRNGLALWYPFNEQPLDAVQVEDHSTYAGNAFINGLAAGDRKFDPVRGNYLSAHPGLLLNSPVARGFEQVFSGGFWIRALNSYAAEQTILTSGPLKITLSGAITTPRLNFYLTYADGSVNLKGFQTFDQKWSYFAWSFGGFQTLTVYYWSSTGSLTVQAISVTNLLDFATPYHLTVSCQNSPFDIQDLRLWNVVKTQDELTLARYHSPSPTACLYRPTWLQSVNTYDHYAVKVLPSGYVVPDQLPTSIITDNLAWVQRYDYLARYDAQSRYKETGVGGGNALPVKQALGSVWDTLTADGTVAVSTWQGNYPGVNKVWLFDNPSGLVLTLIESGSTISGITGTLASTGTGSPWPNALRATNPCRDRIWRKGDDGFVWQIMLANTEAGNVSFVTEKIFSSNGSYQPTGAEVELSDATLHKQLSVNTSGVVYSGTYTGTATSAPIYLYANEETVIDLAGTNTVNAWVQPNTFGLAQTPPVAALKNNGQIAFEVNNQMLPGFYRLTVTSGNIGKVDTSFAGFSVVITVGDIIFQGKLCAGQTGANFSQTDTFDFYLPHTLPGSPSSWLLLFDWSNAIRDNQKGTARQLFISEVNLTRFHTSLYRLTVGAGSIVTTKFGTSGTDYPTTPGGWMATMSSWGTAYGYQHESQIYSSNDTLSNPQPFSNKLTATTSYRTEDIVLNGSFTIRDAQVPAFMSFGPLSNPCGAAPVSVTLLPEPSSDISSVLPTIGDPPVGGALVGSTFYLITVTGKTFTSTDGLTWVDLSGDANTFGLTYTGLIYGGGLFIAFSTGLGSFATSPDAITWTHVQPSGGAGGGMGRLKAGLFFGGQFHISDDDADIFTSSDWTSSDGTLYSFTSASNLNNIRHMASNNSNLNVAVGLTGYIFFSADADSWTEADDGAFFSDWTGVAFGNGIFVAVGSSPRVITSADGNTWVEQITVIDADLTTVCFGNGLFVACSQSEAWSSPDGITWTPITFTLPGTRTFNDSFYLTALTFLGYEKHVPAPSVILVPTESTGWSGVETVFGWAEVGGVLYGLGASKFYSTVDGAAFSIVSTHAIVNPTSLTYGLGLFVAGSESAGSKKTWTSPDGITWTSHVAGCQPIFISFGNGLFVAVGDGINVTVSPDALVWTNQAVLPIGNPRGIAFGAGLFIAVGAGGLVSSPDGVAWTSRDVNNWRGVAFVDGQFIAVGSSGIISTSPDGLVWTAQTSGTGNDLASTGGGGGALIAVSAFGTTNVYQSIDGGITWSFLKHEINDDFPSAIAYYSVANVIDAGFFV